MKKESYSNQDIAKLAHALDDICLTCKHRWGHETNEVREQCRFCRLFDGRAIRYKAKPGIWDEPAGGNRTGSDT